MEKVDKDTQTTPTQTNVKIKIKKREIKANDNKNNNKTQQITNSNNREKNENDKFKCKICPNEFDSLQACLSHELIHINIQQQNNNSGNNKSNRRKRKKPKSNRNIPKLQELEATIRSNRENKEFKEHVIKLLSECQNGTELNCLCRIFQPMPEDITLMYETIYIDLNTELLRTGYEWQIIPFGSTIMGMAFKGSDIDFYVYPFGEDELYTERVYRTVINVLRRSKKFKNIITIPKARVPIIKCTHIVTGYNLDLNVSSVLGVHGSQFIANLLNIDSRIHPLMLIIKIWAKLWNLNGTGRITNYCLTLMIITYLQCIKPSILPSIKELQENINEYLVKGINYAFNTNYFINNDNLIRNEHTVQELLQGFFKFYSEFDFQNYIICPYLGKMINRNDFITKKFQFPEYYKLLQYLKINYPTIPYMKRELHSDPIKLNSLICIQDPFCLNHNNLNSIGKNIYELLRFHLIHANQICSDFKYDSSLLSKTKSKSELESPTKNPLLTEFSKEMLIRLFFEEPTPMTILAIKEKMIEPISSSSNMTLKTNETVKQTQEKAVETSPSKPQTPKITILKPPPRQKPSSSSTTKSQTNETAKSQTNETALSSSVPPPSSVPTSSSESPKINNQSSSVSSSGSVSSSSSLVNALTSVPSTNAKNAKSMVIRICPIESELLYVRQYLRVTYPNQSFNKIEINKIWIEKIIEFTKEIFVNIFKIQLNENHNDKIFMKYAKVSRTNFKESDVHDIKKFSLICELKAIIDTWSNRPNEFKRSYSKYLNEQFNITKLYETQRNQNNYPANLNCRLIMKPDTEFTGLTLTFDDLTSPPPSSSSSRKRKCNNGKVNDGNNIGQQNLKMFFIQYTEFMRFLYRAYFENLK